MIKCCWCGTECTNWDKFQEHQQESCEILNTKLVHSFCLDCCREQIWLMKNVGFNMPKDLRRNKKVKPECCSGPDRYLTSNLGECYYEGYFSRNSLFKSYLMKTQIEMFEEIKEMSQYTSSNLVIG